MKRRAGLMLAAALLVLVNTPVYAAPAGDTLEAIKENIQSIELDPKELARKAEQLYEEYGDELVEKAGQLYEEYGKEVVEKAWEIYEEKAGEVIEHTGEEIKKGFLASVGDFFSDMGKSVVDFCKGLFS